MSAEENHGTAQDRPPGPPGLMRPGSSWRTGVFLAVSLVGFAVVNGFWRYLTTGLCLDFRPAAYYGDLTTPLGEVLRYPLDVLSHPWMILVTGLMLGVEIFVPIIVAVLYRARVAAAFVVIAAVLGHAPVLALVVAVGCAVAGRVKLRNEMPFLAAVLGLLLVGAYLALSAVAGVDAASVLPLQRWVLYAPFLVAFVSAVLAAAIVLALARLTGFRPGVVCPVLVVLLAGPVTAFYLKTGPDELDYALIAGRLAGGESLFEDEALEPWGRRHGAEGLTPSATAVRVHEDLNSRRDELTARCAAFLDTHPDTDHAPAIRWLRAQAASLRLDEPALAGGLIRYTASFVQPESAEHWQELVELHPGTVQGAVARWRLAELTLRSVAGFDGNRPPPTVGQAREHLRKAAERLAMLFPAAADRLAVTPPPRVFNPPPDLPGREYCRQALDSIDRLLWLVNSNAVASDANSAEALGAYLDLDPRGANYYQQLIKLLSDPARKREKTKMGDNLKLAVALQTPDVYERAEMLILLAEEVGTDAAIAASFELGKLTLRPAEAPVIGLVKGIKTPQEYFKDVIASPQNPYQRRAAELLASLAAPDQAKP